MSIRRAAILALALSALAAGPLAGGAHNAAARERGSHLYASHCEVCHGADGQGAIGPELTGEVHHKNHQQTVAWIKDALPPMPRLYPYQLSDQDVEDLASFVTSL
jgi:mono/diheme cytochrome c family protein